MDDEKLILKTLLAWLCLIFLLALAVHAIKSYASEPAWQLVLIDAEHRLVEGAVYRTRGECLLDAGAYKGQTGIMWAACVAVEVGV